MSILVTGAAGFIGFHVAKALLERGERIVGIDNLNEYYDVHLKEARLARLRAFPGFEFAKLDVADRDGVLTLVERHKDLRSIIHLAAQAGVRYSLENPYAYIDANVTGTLVMFEAARRIEHLTASPMLPPPRSTAPTANSLSASMIGSIIRSRSMPRQSAAAN